ncbi:periplasmic Cu(I)/Cu(II)-binding protein CopK [Crenobacter cavernae]|uniref:Copper resistance protein CopK n=1 Tax=Crenobacter cavernae TaxID=2290923 RepID=A0A345Y4D7_9NEIS|nr:periplasmic Cu(I)/Cu(II)-binding protein CopK [Crenobacter cavernae]AXK38789.1 copper resistance protein CopK [Crenobacter cavernae]
MLKKLLMIAALGAVAAPAFAHDAARAAAQQIIELKDGATLYVFKDGKMSMENKLGRAFRMKPGEVMETKDGQKLMMVGDEVMRLESLLKEGHQGN